MTTVIFIHGTSVREPQFSETFELIKNQLRKELPALDVIGCSWGDSLGAKLNNDGASIPAQSRWREPKEMIINRIELLSISCFSLSRRTINYC